MFSSLSTPVLWPVIVFTQDQNIRSSGCPQLSLYKAELILLNGNRTSGNIT